ncbi:MAG: penicillin-binding protein activator [Pseudomonadota bacterium]
MKEHIRQQHKRSRAPIALLLSITLLLSACASTGGTFGAPSGESRAERLADNGNYEGAAQMYRQLASTNTGVERDRLSLLAAQKWLDAGNLDAARSVMRSVSRPSDLDAGAIWDMNAATLHLYDGESEQALAILEPMSRASLPRGQRLRVESLRADAWLQQGDPVRAIELMMQREVWLNRSRELRANREHLWAGLVQTDPQLLRESMQSTIDADIQAWLSLSSLAASTGQQGIGWVNGANRWRNEHRGHEANTILDGLSLPDEVGLDYPQQIALLLPLSGRNARIGEAIQNGFMGAYFAALPGLDDAQSLQIYDVVAEGGASAAYESAVANGAQFVIGPLLRGNVESLANDTLVPVPILTLNYLPEDSLAPPGLYQFGLAPEDEARSAAARAIADGHQRAVALYPSNDWGRRVFQSFASEFETLGGTVLDYRSFRPSEQDFSNTIENLMSLSGSVNRYTRLRANLGKPLQFDPRRRQDTDFIFLAADASVGRLLKSQLKFHYSGDIPAYSTSSIYSMDGRSNSDLNGILFTDTPWVISPHVWIQDLPEMYAAYWPDQRRLGRLHAMGYDAYQLIAGLFAANSGPMPVIDGATGRLFLDMDGRVRRQLAWAQFQNGEPVALPDVDISGGPIPDLGDLPDAQAPQAADDEAWDVSGREL